MKENPYPGQVLRSVENFGDYTDPRVPVEESDVEVAKIATSEVRGSGNHKPVLDIDFPVKAIPSTTEGHFHLFIDRELSWEHYERLLHTLADVGIVEQGYVNASIDRRYTAVRLPWVKKGGA